MSNHLHLVVEARDNPALARGMKRFGVLLAKRLNKLWGRKGRVLADRYHLRVIAAPKELRNVLVYVLNNGRKHGSWNARRPDRYSSGEEFDGWREGRSSWARDPMEMCAESGTRAAKPRGRRRFASSIDAFEAQFGTREERERARARWNPYLGARSWLLCVGWRRHGLIGLMERPVQVQPKAGARRGRE
jgi:hypothetical protein